MNGPLLPAVQKERTIVDWLAKHLHGKRANLG